MFRFARVSGQRIDGRLAHRSPLSTSPLWRACLAFCMFSLAAAFFLWFRGIHIALMAAGLRVAVAGWSLAVLICHALRVLMISLQGGCLVVKRETAVQREGADFDRSGLHVRSNAGDRSSIMVLWHGWWGDLGRLVCPERH